MRRFLLAMAVFCTLAACNGGSANPPASLSGPVFGAVVLSPTSTSFGCPPASTTFTASQSGYGGAFTATSADTNNETVAAGPGVNQFTVTRAGATTSTPVNITVTGGASMTAVFTANNIGCVCMRHHDMWNAHLRPTHPKHRR